MSTTSETAVASPTEKYDQYNHLLFDLIDEIEQSKILDSILTIPSVVAAGDQTSGKSSVLGKLSGVALPTGDGTVTLCATQLALRKSSKRICRMEFPVEKEISDITEICAEVNATQVKLAPSEGGFIFDVMPRIRIENPEARNVTVVDLPGIIHSATKSQDESVVENVRNMVMKHIESPRAIILCVIDSTRDLALNKIFQLVNYVDKEGDRTIVVFTKLDRCLADNSRLRHFLAQVKSQDYHTFKNHVFVNSLLDDESEADFFQDVCSQYGLSMDNCTYRGLYSKVCHMLLKPVLTEFRTSWTDVEKYRNKLLEEKNRLPKFLGDPVAMSNMRLTEFIDTSREALKGTYCGRRQMDLFSRYRQCFRNFKQEYQEKMAEVTHNYETDEIVVRWRHQEMINFSNWLSFKSYAVPIICSFINPAIRCHNAVRAINKEALTDLIWDIFDGQDAHANFLMDRINSIFETQEHVLNDRIQHVLDCEEYFYTDDEMYERLLDKFSNSNNAGSAIRTAPVVSSLAPPEPTAAAPEGKKGFKLKKKSFSGSTMTLNKALPDQVTEVVVVDQEVEYTKDDMKKFDNNLETFYQQTKTNKHNKSKQFTYDVALNIMKELAMDRISVVVPGNILQCLNQEVQKLIQLIDRDSNEFCELPWVTTDAQKRRMEIDRQESLIRKWRNDFLRVEKQILNTA